MANEPKPDHRLAAIMATDVAGYSKLMETDEALALAALAAIRQATQNQIVQHRGRIANTAGDSVLAEFGSAVEAVRCAMALQQELSSRDQGEGLRVASASISAMWSTRVATCSVRRSMSPRGLKALRSPEASWCRQRCGMPSPGSS
jgi:class 3 adenylate cyclase